jgi:hypothetical protein
MNNYESPNVAEIGTASKLIRGSKFWWPDWIDNYIIIDFMDNPVDDIDETDD